jgi:hypothetical protein
MYKSTKEMGVYVRVNFAPNLKLDYYISEDEFNNLVERSILKSGTLVFTGENAYLRKLNKAEGRFENAIATTIVRIQTNFNRGICCKDSKK